MDLRRLRGGELIAALAGAALIVSMFLDWYQRTGLREVLNRVLGVKGSLSAWDSPGVLGGLADLVILAAGVTALFLAIAAARSRTVALPVATSAVTTALGGAAVLLILLRMVFRPGPNDETGLDYGIFLALVAALAVTYGGWQSMQEEGGPAGRRRRPPVDEGPAAPSPPEGPPARGQ